MYTMKKLAIRIAKDVLYLAIRIYQTVNRILGYRINPFPVANVLAFFVYTLPILNKRIIKEWLWEREGAIILLYHEIDSQTFEQHVKHIMKYWDIISLDDLLERIRRKQNLKNSIIITFDDGWKSNYTNVLPIIRKYNISITLYVVSNLIDTEKELWTLTIKNLRLIKSKANKVVVQNTEYFKSISNRKREAEIDELISRLGYTVQERSMLSLSEIREMIDSKLVFLGSHSRGHPCLTMMADDEANDEIISSRKDLESKLGVNSVVHFSYPNGDYNDSHIKMLKNAGYSTAVTMIPGPNTHQTDPYQLRRVLIDSRMNRYTLGLNISGLWHLLGLDADVIGYLRRREIFSKRKS